MEKLVLPALTASQGRGDLRISLYGRTGGGTRSSLNKRPRFAGRLRGGIRQADARIAEGARAAVTLKFVSPLPNPAS